MVSFLYQEWESKYTVFLLFSIDLLNSTIALNQIFIDGPMLAKPKVDQ